MPQDDGVTQVLIKSQPEATCPGQKVTWGSQGHGLEELPAEGCRDKAVARKAA